MTTKDTYEMIINGRKVTTDQVVEVINPANETVFATVARANLATCQPSRNSLALAFLRHVIPSPAVT